MNAPFDFEGIPQEQLQAPGDEPWAWWQESLVGRPPVFVETAPQTGFYRYRRRAADRGSPCAIWHEDGRWWCMIDGAMFDAIDHAWRYAHKHPISETLFTRVGEGGSWPDELPATEGTPQAGHNTATPEVLALEEVRNADEAFTALVKEWGGAVSNEEQDTAAAAYDGRISKLRIEAEKARKREKDEFLKGGQAIDAKWNPVKTAAEAAETRISQAATAYRVERTRLEKEAADKARIERERLAKEHADKVAAAAAANAPPPPPPMPTTTFVPKRATGLRKHDEVVFDDMKATVDWVLAMKPVPTDFIETMKTIANRRFAHGPVPGARIESTWKA